MLTNSTIYNSPEAPVISLAKEDTHIFKSHDYEELHSPSTDYTDIPENDHSTPEFSTRFLNEISTFEPLVESMPQFSLEFNTAGNKKVELQDNRNEWENDSSAHVRSRKVSCDTTSVCDDDSNAETVGWNEKKEKLLKNLAAKCKYDWKKITKKFNTSEESNFTPVFLKDKYKKLNKVAIPLRVKFTREEDLMIAKYFNLYGCDWNQIATHFTDRTPIMLKNRYYSHIRKKNLLNAMLEEVKGCEDPTNTTPSNVSSPINDEDCDEAGNDGDTIQIFVANQQGVSLRKLSVNSFSSVYFEVENSLATELYDRITYSQI